MQLSHSHCARVARVEVPHPFGRYTDKQIFTLTADGSGCQIEACSRSQVTSFYDYGTNYCDLKMLYCGSEAGCKPVKHDFSVGTETTKAFYESSVDLAACLKVPAPRVLESRRA